MLLVSDIHGRFSALGEVASRGEPLLVLGDLINLVDYRTGEGIFADVLGLDFARKIAASRGGSRFEEMRALWRERVGDRYEWFRAEMTEHVKKQYRLMAQALEASESYVTYGNVDRPEMLRQSLPEGSRFVDGEVVVIEGRRVGFAGGGLTTPMNASGEVSDREMADKLAGLGEVDILCTHLAPRGAGPAFRCGDGKVREGFPSDSRLPAGGSPPLPLLRGRPPATGPSMAVGVHSVSQCRVLPRHPPAGKALGGWNVGRSSSGGRMSISPGGFADARRVVARTVAGLVSALPQFVKLVARLSRDPRVPARAKRLAAALAAYVVSPVDLIPDVIPGVGLADDLLAVAVALAVLIEAAPDEVVAEHWGRRAGGAGTGTPRRGSADGFHAQEGAADDPVAGGRVTPGR